MNKPGILLEVVQILTDLDLIITKAYISSDGGWFMDSTYMLLLFLSLFFLMIMKGLCSFYAEDYA